MKNDEEISKKDKFVFGTGIVVTILIVSVSGWLYFASLRKPVNKTQTTEITPTSEPVKILEVDYKDKEIQVLNGSGIASRAKKLTDELKNMGYLKVTAGNYEKIITGNILMSPTDFGKDINLKDYQYEKSETIKIIIGK